MANIIEPLNHNVYGILFEAVGLSETNSDLWTRVYNQDHEISLMIKTLEPNMPRDFNNVLQKTDTCQFCPLPYKLKYITF